MKRLVWFAALFMAGLGVLLWFELRRSRGPGKTAAHTSESASEFVPPIDVPSGPSGNFETDVFDDRDPAVRRKRWTVKFEALSYDAADSAFRAGRTHLLGFGDAGSEPIAELVAQSSRIPSTVGARPGMYELGKQVVLRDVDARLENAGVLGALHLVAAELEGKLDEQEFWSKGTARIDGDGLSCNGTGPHVWLADSRLTFASRASIELSAGPDHKIVLTCDGPLEVSAAPPEQGGLLTVRARDGARLTSNTRKPGQESIVLEGDLLTVLAVPRPDGSLALQQLLAEGKTAVSRGGWRADGERATVVLGSDGLPRSLRIEGSPTARLPLSDPRLGEKPVDATWSGTGPLEAVALEPLELVMNGPTRVDVLGRSLSAQREIRASMPAKPGDPRRLRADGAVVLESDGWSLEAPSLDTAIRELERGVFELDARTDGATLLRPLGEEPPTRWMRAEGGAQLVASERGWTLPLARSVRMHWEDVPSFDAQATEIRDFDPRGPSFRADGSFLLTSGETTATGTRAVVRDATHATVEGSPDAPAVLERPGERISAQFVERDGDVLRARGEIDALAESDGARRTVLADSLEVRHAEGRNADGSTWRSVDLDSRGSVRASLVDERGSADIVCSSLLAHAVVTTGPSGPDRSLDHRTTTFEASGVVQSRFTFGPDTWELSCGRVTGTGASSGAVGKLDDPLVRAAALRDTRVDAYDGVAFARLGAAPLRGRAGHVAIVGAESAVLEPDPGELIHAEGLLQSSTPRVFKVEARALTLDGKRWSASHPQMWISALAPGGGFAVDPASPDLLRLRADDIVYDAPLVELSGAAEVHGTTTRGEPFDVTAGSLRFALADTPDALARRIQGLAAKGGFALHFGEILAASGEELELRRGPGALRMTGDPVRLRWHGVEFASPWIELDLVLRALRTGKFTSQLVVPAAERRP
ncbi:MAG: hypothetical protein EPO68_00780 [Planctomycetota bacterium]|nr:MAG: hypothetical protein EPO68_00780 [Planctomycetota bacterium]